jgi:pyridoxal phosphate enzyme (YggS family)
MIDSIEIAGRLEQVRSRIESSAHRARRDVASIRLVLASKTQPASAIRAAYEAGARDFGENYVQEALAKRADLADLRDLRWHLIGHLQTNKAKVAAASFELIQSVDSTRLVEALARTQKNPPVHALLEVNLGCESSKSGAAIDQVEAILESARGITITTTSLPSVLTS